MSGRVISMNNQEKEKTSFVKSMIMILIEGVLVFDEILEIW
jgi:hypothetical protein